MKNAERGTQTTIAATVQLCIWLGAGAEKLFLSVRIIAEFFRQNFRKRLIIALGDRLVGPKDFAIRCNHFGIDWDKPTKVIFSG